MAKVLSRQDARAVLQASHDQVLRPVAGLPEAAATLPGIGGGEWSVKDLLGHLTSWEEDALGAIGAWSRGETAPPIHKASEKLGLDGVNQLTFEEKFRLSNAEALQSFDEVHERLLTAIAAMSDEKWRRKPAAERNWTLGEELGGILAGSGPSDHAEVHLAGLRDWVGLLRKT